MILVGTSGYNYPEWKGSFYPSDLPARKMLGYYAEHFSTVEINYTFYRMPTEKILGEWASTTPEGFMFTLKAPRRITHQARLRDCEDLLDTFCSRALTLGPKLGVLLFQLPPWAKKDVELLTTFLGWMPGDIRAAFEFRNSSWYASEVYAALRDKNLALCITDTEKDTAPMEMTADYTYFRLRDEGYKPSDIARWGDTIAEHASDLKDAFVYFKHEEEGKGAEFTQTLVQNLESR